MICELNFKNVHLFYWFLIFLNFHNFFPFPMYEHQFLDFLTIQLIDPSIVRQFNKTMGNSQLDNGITSNWPLLKPSKINGLFKKCEQCPHCCPFGRLFFDWQQEPQTHQQRTTTTTTTTATRRTITATTATTATAITAT